VAGDPVNTRDCRHPELEETMAAVTMLERTLDRVRAPYAPGRARWAKVQIEAEQAVYVGRMYIPETRKRLSDVLSDERPFISLTEVSINDGAETEPFLAINKRYVLTVRVLDEGTSTSMTTEPSR
jgi:hypothetical protein